METPNPHGLPNSSGVVPWVNGMDITRRARNMWIVDFGVGMPETDAARFEAPFGLVTEAVKAVNVLSRGRVMTGSNPL